MESLVSSEPIERKIYVIRDCKVMLDADLAVLYGVTTKVLNQAVKRNGKRFPSDFMFRLTLEESEALRSQIVTSKIKTLRRQFGTLRGNRGGRRYLPFVFTEHGAVMLASVLNSSIAIETSIQIARAFNKIRELLATHKDLARKLEELEEKYDSKFKIVFDAIRQLMERPSPAEPKLLPLPVVKGFSHKK